MDSKQIGRISISITRDGKLQHDYGYGCAMKLQKGWNPHCGEMDYPLSISELRDIQYMIGELLRGV
jgi:hypothetical protein